MGIQDKRILSLTTSLGGDALLLESLQARERLSEPFEIVLDLIADRVIDPAEMLGTSMTVTMVLEAGGERYWNGLVARFEQILHQGEKLRYRAELRPGFWYLQYTGDCKIFQNQSVPDIIDAVLGDFSFITKAKSLSGSYESREYCVQYRESDYHFISRLLEEEGIHYYFVHADGKHTLTLADSNQPHQPTSNYDTLNFHHQTGMLQLPTQITHWNLSKEVLTGKWALRDYDYNQSRTDLTSQMVKAREHALDNLDFYDYPGRYKTTAVGDVFAKIHLGAEDAKFEIGHAQAEAWGVVCGATFTLADHPVASQNRQYLILQTDIRATTNPYASDQSEFTWQCQFRCLPVTVDFRPPLKTPRPIIQGPQTAVVVGKSGDEIHTDSMGRVKVQFHWDRYGENNENSSCWIRVAQVWAGKGWGALFIPRVGHEVVVNFIDGDPDRPLVTGAVYNDQNTPAITLPDNMTQSGWQSRSTKSGDANTYNEIRFEDKKDSEEIYVHAEKDYKRVVENNDTQEIGLVKKDKGDQTITIQNNRTVTLNEGTDECTVKKGDHKLTVSEGNRTAEISKGNDTLTIKQGNLTVDISAGACSIEAAKSITLTVGGSSIKIEPSKITISSTTVSISGSASVEVNGAQTTVKGSATVTIQGGMVQIN